MSRAYAEVLRDHLSIETSLDRYAALYYELAAKAPNGARV
jgi:hypothetical protein